MARYYFIFFLLFAFASQAQINEQDTLSLAIQVQVGGSHQKGNVELSRVTGRVELLKQVGGQLVLKSQNSYLFQKIVGRKADENIESRNFLYYNPQSRLYPYAIFFLSTNYRRDVDLRYFGGLGATYQLLRTPRHNLKLSGNGLYEKSFYTNDLYNKGEFDGNSMLEAFWYSAYLSGFHKVGKQGLRLVYEVYWQQSVSNAGQFRFHVATGLDINVMKGLGIQSRYNFSYENVVALGNSTEDTLWTWGLIYQINKP